MLSGMVLSPGGIAICICMPIVGFLLRKYQARWLVIFGVTVSVVGLIRMSHFTLDVDYSTAVWGRVVQSLGLAFLFVPISTLAFSTVARERVNYATGLFNLARNIGGSSGIAAITTILARRAQYHQSVLVSHMTPYDPAYRDALAKAAAAVQSGGASSPDAAAQAQGLLYGTLLKQSSMLAFSDAFWIMAVLFLAIIPLMFLIKKTAPPRGPIMVE
jgi:DHA2 family multidrug resistance protein